MLKKTQMIYWSSILFRDWKLHLAATDKGLCTLMLPDGTFEEMRKRVVTCIPGAQLMEDAELMKPYTRQLIEYLSGERSLFTLPLDLRGTPFQIAVWNALCSIPYGETRSYSDIAQEVGSTKAMRAVGAANRANPIAIVVPCHRVIGKHGSLTGYAGGGLPVKAALLQMEKRKGGYSV